MAITIVADKMITDFTFVDDLLVGYKTTLIGHRPSDNSPVVKEVEYTDADGFAAAFYSDPTNSDEEIDGIPDPT